MKLHRPILSLFALLILLAAIGLNTWRPSSGRLNPNRSPASGPQAVALTGTDSASCVLDAAKPDLICNMDSIPAYFANVTPDGKYVAYIDYNNPKYGGLSDWIIRLDDCKTKIRIPGLTDPVPSPDGVLIATPNTPKTPHSGYALYHWSDIAAAEKSGQASQPKLAPSAFEPKIAASYESIGVLKPQDAAGKTTYRITGGAAVFNDFERVGKKINHAGPYNRPACKNINTAANPNKLPKISKDGKFIGNYITSDGVDRTQIYALHDDGSCSLALDLGIPTGKVEFSYDGKQIAFHVDSFAEDGEAHFATISRNMVKNVYVVDVDPVGEKLIPKGIRRLTNNTTAGSGSYYPSFDRQGRIVYIQQNINAAGKVSYAFQRVNPNLNASEPLFVNPTVSGCHTKAATAFFALGDLYECVCPVGKKLEASPTNALWSLGLNPSACQSLVQKHWAESKTKVKAKMLAQRNPGQDLDRVDELSINDLLAACPGPSTPGPTHPTLLGKAASLSNEVPDNGQRNPQQIFNSVCAECHNGSQQLNLEWNKLRTDPLMKSLIPEMIRRIGDPDDSKTPLPNDEESMPKGSRMNKTQARILIKALRALNSQ